jgi:DNA-directed RNA polymerase specialized sigma24 family protein
MAPAASSGGQQAGDASLIQAVRDGDVSAFSLLYERHLGAARRLARQLAAPADAGELATAGFSKVLGAVQRGEGPTESFRAFLLSSIHGIHLERTRAVRRVSVEQRAAAAIFRSLPERWQMVLWHLEVEGQQPRDVAPLLAMTPESVSALAYRAREGLRQAYLEAHLAASTDEDCRWAAPMLGAYVRNALSARQATQVDTHLDSCARCTGLYLALCEVNSDLGAVLAPGMLGNAAGDYLATTPGRSAATRGVSGTRKILGGGLSRLAVQPFRSAGAAGGAAAAVVVVAVMTAAVASLGQSPNSPATAQRNQPPAVAERTPVTRTAATSQPAPSKTPRVRAASVLPATTSSPSPGLPPAHTAAAPTAAPSPSPTIACATKDNLLLFGVDLVEDVINTQLTDGPRC